MALGYMRRHKRWLYVFLWIIIAAFIVLYVPALDPTAQGTASEAVVTVGDREVSVGEYQRTYFNQIRRLSSLYQGRLDDNMIRRLGLQEQILDSLIVDRLVELEAERLGLEVSRDAIAREIRTSPQFQDADGRFVGPAELRRLLDLQGMTEQAFEESLRRQLLRERLEALVSDGVVVSDKEAEQEFRRRTENVELEYVLVAAEPFEAEIEPTDDEIQARFDADPEAYRIPEKRVVSYVLLDRDVLSPRVEVTDRDIARYYQDHRDEFLQEEEFCARHILVKVSSGADDVGHEEEEARRIAQALLGRVQDGADFAALATASSEDLGSASNGGDLGCFPAGRMVPEFDDALYELDPGETSGLVRTSFGYHIIRLESRREETTLPLDDVEERVRLLVTDEKMVELGDELSVSLASALRSGEKTLEAAAEELGLEVQASEPFARGETPPVLASPTLVARVFEMSEGQAEKEGFALPQGAAFLALQEIQESRVPGLDEVKDQVRADLVEEGARAAAHAQAEEVRDRARTAGLERAANRFDLVRKETLSPTAPGQPLGDLGTGLALDEAAFSLPVEEVSDPVPTADGWAVLRVTARNGFDPEAFETERPRIVASLRQQKQGQVFQAYMGSARDRYEVRRNSEAYRRALGQDR